MIQTAQNLPKDDLGQLKQEFLAAVAGASDIPKLEDVRVAALGKKGRITELMKTLGALVPEARKERGAALNVLKDEIAGAIEARQKQLAQVGMRAIVAEPLPVAARELHRHAFGAHDA